MYGNLSSQKRCSQKPKQITAVHPETALEYFQISVNVVEATKLAWSRPGSANSYVVVMLGKEKHRTSVKKNMDDPCYREQGVFSLLKLSPNQISRSYLHKEFIIEIEYFLFEWFATVLDIQHSSLSLAVMETKCCCPPRLLGETSIHLEAVWTQPNHQIFHKWTQLNLPFEPEAGPVGFLKVDVSIVCRGAAQLMPMIVNEGRLESDMLTVGTDQQTANYLITVYGAYGLPLGSYGHIDRGYVKPPNTYVKVSFCGLTCKTAVQYRTCNPAFCEQISIIETFPNICQLIRLEVCISEANKVLGSADMHLGLISHDGENGFIPTFGPSLVHMYGSSPYEASCDEGPYHKGALLVALKTVVPYYKQGLRTTNVEPVIPIQLDDLWCCEDFLLLCPILEVSMLDDSVGKCSGVAINVGETPCGFKTDAQNKESKKLYYTGSLKVERASLGYGHLEFSNAFPVLQLAMRLQDFRTRMYTNNMVRAIGAHLYQTLSDVDKTLASPDNTNFIELVDILLSALDHTAAGIQKFLDLRDVSNQKPGCSSEDLKYFETELHRDQLTLQMNEMKKVSHQIYTLLNMARRSSNDSLTTTKKELKLMVATVKTISQNINNVIFSSASEGWPQIVIWLLNGCSRFAYCKISLADVLYSVIPEQCGTFCGRVRTIYLKPLKCTKHLNSVSTCSCIAGKIELLTWLGVYDQVAAFTSCLPKAYKLKSNEYNMCLKTSVMMLHCRIYIHMAKISVCPENTHLPSPFVRAHVLNSVEETEVETNTHTPIWNVVLHLQTMAFISQSRLKSDPPYVMVEVYDNDATGKTEILGRVEIQPIVDDRASYLHAPKLQWRELTRGLETTGQILLSAQLLQVPETMVKSIIYTTVDETCTSSLEEDVVKVSPERLPSCLLPQLNTYKVDIYWWGLRGVANIRKPCAVLVIDELIVKSDIIPQRKLNCNFPNGRSSHVLKAALNELYCPPLLIRLCDSSTFGRTLFQGTYVVKNPNKYMVDWLPRYAREVSLKCASVTSSHFVQVSDAVFVKNSLKKVSKENNDSIMTINSGILQSRKETPCWKKLFCKREFSEEEFVLLPAFTKERDRLNVVANVPVDDWWMRYYSSLKIYHSELELQPEFTKFKDWCQTLKLYSGKKTGIAETDAKLRCGFLKAGIAIYKWPPPENTAVVNASGVELANGYFKDYPVNDPAKFLVRVYIVRGLNLVPRCFTGKCEPYVVINCGSRHTTDSNRKGISFNTLNPVFGKMYEFQCCLPEDYILTISLHDHEASSQEDLIGSTTIDLEDRVYSKHRACVGLASHYKVTGPSKWRDFVKPSRILEEICSKNHISPPIYLDNNTVIINGVHYKDTDESNKTYLSASERKENICLEILHKWHTLTMCGYQLVPEHVETRKLFNVDKPGDVQGQLHMWVDIFPLDTTGIFIPLPVDITPRKVQDYELRVTIWTVKIIPSEYLAEQRKDICVKAWIGSAEHAQLTDIHHRSVFEGIFNWRMIFDFKYQEADKTMVLIQAGPFTEEEEQLLPLFILQVVDCGTANDKHLGTITLDLTDIPRGSKVEYECKLRNMNDLKRNNLFSLKSIRGWWPLNSPDWNTGTTQYAGAIELEMSLLPKEIALLSPVGVGRDPPIPLPEPNRPEQYQVMGKSSLLAPIGRCVGTKYILIGSALVIVTFAAVVTF